MSLRNMVLCCVVSVGIALLLVLSATCEAQQPVQGLPQGSSGRPSNFPGSTRLPGAQPLPQARYQYFPGQVPCVVDSHTGKVYNWFPRDPKEGKGPYLLIQDFVSGTESRVEIKEVTSKQGKTSDETASPK